MVASIEVPVAADRPREFHECGQFRTRRVGEPRVERPLCLEEGEGEDVAEFLFQAPGPEGPLVGLGEVSDHTFLGSGEVLPVPSEEEPQPFELLGGRNRAYAERQPFRWTVRDVLGVILCAIVWTLLPTPVAVVLIVAAVGLRLGRSWASSRWARVEDAEADDVDQR